MPRSAIFSLWLLIAPAMAAPQDPVTGLIVAPGWELVRAHCGTCHAHRMVTSQRGDATFWMNMIRRMERAQNLGPLEAGQARTIVAYLADNYDETEWGRRPPLSTRLLPEPSG